MPVKPKSTVLWETHQRGRCAERKSRNDAYTYGGSLHRRCKHDTRRRKNGRVDSQVQFTQGSQDERCHCAVCEGYKAACKLPKNARAVDQLTQGSQDERRHCAACEGHKAACK